MKTNPKIFRENKRQIKFKFWRQKPNRKKNPNSMAPFFQFIFRDFGGWQLGIKTVPIKFFRSLLFPSFLSIEFFYFHFFFISIASIFIPFSTDFFFFVIIFHLGFRFHTLGWFQIFEIPSKNVGSEWKSKPSLSLKKCSSFVHMSFNFLSFFLSWFSFLFYHIFFFAGIKF